MLFSSARHVLTATALVGLLFTPAIAQDGEEPELPEVFDEPMALFTEALGDFGYPISSAEPEVQEYFDQGLQMMYAFTKVDAARSFREAWKRDPNCAICYWGEAWSWGSYLNGPMRPNEAPHAWAAVQKAIGLKNDYATPKEQALIDAMSVRYVENYDPAMRKEQDEAYRDAMKRVHEAYPEDLDIATLYADSLFLLEPRRGYRDIDDPNTQRLHQQLEKILAVDITHAGACHLYIHATESTTRPDKAEACAEHLGLAIPGASHINHMPSHTWNEVGRWADGVRSNTRAWHSDQMAEFGKGFAIYPQHNLHMLLFAASMDGQGAAAIQAAKDFNKLRDDTMHLVLTLVRFGRFDEVLEVTKRPDADVPGGLWDFAQGYAHLRQGDADFARVYLARVLEAAETSDGTLRFHTAEHILGTVGAILEGEIHRDAGDLEAAIVSLERAVEIEDQLGYDEPEPMPFAARHWLGAALIEAERFADAERVYREELEEHQHNGWSLFGLKQALAAQGKTDPAVDADFEASWARADHWIQASRF